MTSTCSAYSRRAARPWGQRDFLDRLDNLSPPRPQPDKRLNVRLGRVVHIAPVLARVLDGILAANGRPAAGKDKP